jgi:Flp pilus assembly protein TadG
MKAGRFGNQRGVAVVETALTLIPFLVFLFAVVEAGWFFYIQQTITNAAREGAKQGSRPLTQTDEMLDEDEIEAFISEYIATTGMTCNDCVTLTRDTAETCTGCDEDRIGQRTILRVDLPYTPITLSWFSALSFTMHGEAVMRSETSEW